MDLAMNEEQEILKRTAREFLANECPPKLVREMEHDETGFPPELWKKVADLGWQGMIIPEAYGGSGSTLVDFVILLEEMGRALLPGPMLPTIVPCALTIINHGSDQLKQATLPGVSSGDRILTWAQQEPTARYDPKAISTTITSDGSDLVINGTKLFVQYAHVANDILVVGKDGDGLSLILLDRTTPGIELTELDLIDGGKQFEIVFNNVKASASGLIGERGKAEPIVDEALAAWTVAQCAWMVGGMEKSFEMAVEYSKTRVQFGVPIGSFQALQHKAANMAIEVDGSRLITYEAAWQVSSGASSDREVAMAKAWVSDAFRKVSADAHQMHGAIGFTMDYDLQLFTRRAKVMEIGLGDGDYHRQRVATAIGL